MEASSPSAAGSVRDELQGDAQTLANTATDKIHQQVDANKGAAVDQAQSLSSALNAAAGESPDWLRSLLQQGAQSLQRFSDTIRSKDSRQLTQEVQRLARNNPGVFLAGCAAAGFAAARVLKAGAEDTTSSSTTSNSSQTGSSDSQQGYEPSQAQGAEPSGSVFSGMDQNNDLATFQGAI